MFSGITWKLCSSEFFATIKNICRQEFRGRTTEMWHSTHQNYLVLFLASQTKHLGIVFDRTLRWSKYVKTENEKIHHHNQVHANLWYSWLIIKRDTCGGMCEE